MEILSNLIHGTTALVSIKTVTFLMFCVFAITAVGYVLGRVTIKGVNLGTAGVFIIALLFGALLYEPLRNQLLVKGEAETLEYAGNALKLVENLGLMLFVTSVGFIAGPGFFKGLKKNIKSYILLGAIIIISGGLVCVAVVALGGCNSAMGTGILSGALTSTPAFSSAKETINSMYDAATAANLETECAVGHGIAYIFGVVGVVLFVQLVPKFEKADIAAERAKLIPVDDGSSRKAYAGKLIDVDDFGLAAFALAVVIGIFIGSIKIPMGTSTFSLGTTGGCLLTALVFGHFGRIGKINIMVKPETAQVFREFGLVLFLIGAGIPGGASFVEKFQWQFFLYGALMTIIPMIIGYFFAKKVLKISLFNNLGSITGGMTSTPALGTLVHVAGTDNVASAYAATYPIALVLVVLVSQFIIMLFP